MGCYKLSYYRFTSTEIVLNREELEADFEKNCVNTYRYGFNGMEKNSEWNEGSYDFGARMYDGRSGRWLAIDPYEHKFPNLSPFVFCANNPMFYVDPNGKKYLDFDESGNFIGVSNDTWYHNMLTAVIGVRGRIKNSKGEVIDKFRFADKKNDVKDVESGKIKKIIFVKDEDIRTMLSHSGVFKSENKVENLPVGERYDYIKKEGQGGGKLDFSYSEIPSMYPEASSDPLNEPSTMLFLVGDVAHNHMNFGNFLFGAAGQALGLNSLELSWGAHWNSLTKSEKNGYKSQFDSADDQFSIGEGYKYANEKDFDKKSWKITIGPIESRPTEE